MDAKVAEDTVKTVSPDTAFNVAVIVDVPVATVLANPWLPAALLIVAFAVSDEVHVTVLVRSWVVLSLKVPVAVNCRVLPSGVDGVAGVTAIDANVAAVTVTVNVAETDPLVAVITAVPAFTAVTRPRGDPEVVTVATLVLEEVQVALLVMAEFVLSVKSPVAVISLVVSFASVRVDGVN